MTSKTFPRGCKLTDENGDIHEISIENGEISTKLFAKRKPSEAEIQLKKRIDDDLIVARDASQVQPNCYWLTADELKLAKGFCLPESKMARLKHAAPYEIYQNYYGTVYLHLRSDS